MQRLASSLWVFLCLMAAALPAAAQPTPEEAPTPLAPRLPLGELGSRVHQRLLELGEGSASRLTAIQTDRPIYRPGETIWFQVLRPLRRSLALEGEARLVVELFNPEGRSVQVRVIQQTGGLAANEIELPAHAAGGLWTLRVSQDRTPLVSRTVLVASTSAPRFARKLEFVRRGYAPGDTASATLEIRRPTGAPLAHHPVVAQVQLGGAQLHRIELKTGADGSALIRFPLPADVDALDGDLTVLFSDGGSTEAVSEPIPLLTRRVRLELFPEGGDLVEGLPSRVYFAATRTDGSPTEIAGTVIDDQGHEVATLASSYAGMGRFALTPKPGRTYAVRISTPTGIEAPVALPAALPRGCVLRALDDPNTAISGIRATIQCAEPQEVLLAATARERLFDVARVQVPRGEAVTVHLHASPEVEQEPGVARLTLMTARLVPLAERLVFRHRTQRLSVEIETEQAVLGPREQVTLRVRTRTPEGVPTSATLAVSVVDDGLLSLDNGRSPELATSLLLLPEIVGELDRPNAYMSLKDAEGGAKLDLVMGTRGWRRFEWMPAAFPDQDQDKLPDALDRCPTQAEDWDGYEDEDGCFDDQDDDGDGVPQSRDVCPREPGTADQLGCIKLPPDADQDGIYNNDDKCVTEPEDRDGFEDEDGCPDPDNDRDQIPDVDDRCPNEPETYNGRQDDDGCPEAALILLSGGSERAPTLPPLERSALPPQRVTTVLPPVGAPPASSPATLPPPVEVSGQVRVSWSSIQILERLYFDAGSARLQPRGLPILDEIAAVMQNNPQILQIEVQGHVSTPGGKRGEVLGLRRAEAVRDYLVRRGVEPSRLVVRSWGNVRPIVDPRDPRMRPRNDRVEFYILQTADGIWQAPAQVARVFPAPVYKTPARVGPADLRDTLHWAPAVRTDARGEATLSFYLSDRAGAARIIAEGVGGGLPGRGERVVAAQPPVGLRLTAPPELGVGDRLLLPLDLTNATARPMTLALNARADAPLELAALPALAVPAHATRATTLEASARAPGQVTLQVDARSGALTDRRDAPVKIVAAGFPAQVGQSGVLDAGTPMRFTLDLPTSTSGSLKAGLTFYPSLLADLRSGIEAMLAMPHGCFEQTSSTHYPNVLLLELLEVSGDADPALLRRAHELLDVGYNRIRTFEVKGGGFSWYGDAPPVDFLSALALLELSAMRRVHPVDGDLIARTATWLRSLRDRSGGYIPTSHSAHIPEDTRTAWIAHALAMTPAGLNDLESKRLQVMAQRSTDPFVLAATLLALQATPGQEKAAAALAERLAAMQSDEGSFKGAVASMVGSSGPDLEVQTTALAARALLKAGPRWGDVGQRAIRWLMGKRGWGGRWGSTWSTVLSLEALVTFARTWPAPQGTLHVRINGVELPPLRLPESSLTALTLDGLAPHLKAGANTIELRLSGASALPWSFLASCTTTSPPSSPNAPLRLTTTLPAAARQGEGVRLNLRVENVSAEVQRSGIAVIGLPAGLELPPDRLRDLKAIDPALALVELEPRRLILYLHPLEPGAVVQLPITLQATFPGRFEGPASAVWPYYDEPRRAWAPPLTIAIDP